MDQFLYRLGWTLTLSSKLGHLVGGFVKLTGDLFTCKDAELPVGLSY